MREASIFLHFNSLESILLIGYNIVLVLIFTPLLAICTGGFGKSKPQIGKDVGKAAGTPTTSASPAALPAKYVKDGKEKPTTPVAKSPGTPVKEKTVEKQGKKASERGAKKASERGKSKKTKDDGLVEGDGEGGEGGENDQYDEDGNVRHEKTVRIEMDDDQTKSMTKSKSVSIAESKASKRKKKKDKTVTKEGNSIQMEATPVKTTSPASKNKTSVTYEESNNCSLTFEVPSKEGKSKGEGIK